MTDGRASTTLRGLGIGPVWVCVPTYNEADNVERLARMLLSVFDDYRIDGRVLVIDDGSPDGTADIAARLSADDSRILLLRRSKKDGIGPAYVAGFDHALQRGAEIVAEMDCDFSHDPADLPRLLSGLKAVDVVLGSRYVPGGRVLNWGLLRRLLSRGGCAYAGTVLGLPVRDLTGGYKCFRREALEAIDLNSITSRGYAFQVETTYRFARAGLRIVEVPIVFEERRSGTSKMGRRIVFEALWKVPWLRIRSRSS